MIDRMSILRRPELRGVSVSSRTAFPQRRDFDKFEDLIRIIDGSGAELIGTNDANFISDNA
jgi:hypothetical protein